MNCRVENPALSLPLQGEMDGRPQVRFDITTSVIMNNSRWRSSTAAAGRPVMELTSPAAEESPVRKNLARRRARLVRLGSQSGGGGRCSPVHASEKGLRDTYRHRGPHSKSETCSRHSDLCCGARFPVLGADYTTLTPLNERSVHEVFSHHVRSQPLIPELALIERPVAACTASGFPQRTNRWRSGSVRLLAWFCICVRRPAGSCWALPVLITSHIFADACPPRGRLASAFFLLLLPFFFLLFEISRLNAGGNRRGSRKAPLANVVSMPAPPPPPPPPPPLPSGTFLSHYFQFLC